MTLSIANLAQVPKPCQEAHHGQYGALAFKRYESFVLALIERWQEIGLNQEEVGTCAGLADSHINKLEAFHRNAAPPSLMPWADTLGLEITVRPKELPRATQTAIPDERKRQRV